MQSYKFDTVVVGGGPAGMAAAIAAAEAGAKTAVLERNEGLGGILNQCIHCGFGLHYFKEELTGPEYAERFAKRLAQLPVEVIDRTMVRSIERSKTLTVTAVSRAGVVQLQAGSVVLCTGCRERTRGNIQIPGARPAGVFMAGQAQQYTNVDGLRVGSRCVILGSGDIGLIMARRLTLEGLSVAAVCELMPYPNGLKRNLINCLSDFGIPLYLSTTMTKIIGRDRVRAVEIAQVDENRRPVEGTKRTIDCDTVLLAIGLTPENELARTAGVQLDPATGGPLVDERYETSVPGIFSCGNALHVHDVVDFVTREAQRAGTNAAQTALGRSGGNGPVIPVRPGNGVRYTVPAHLHTASAEPLLSFRVTHPMASATVEVWYGAECLYRAAPQKLEPSIMQQVRLPAAPVLAPGQTVTVLVKEDAHGGQPK